MPLPLTIMFIQLTRTHSKGAGYFIEISVLQISWWILIKKEGFSMIGISQLTSTICRKIVDSNVVLYVAMSYPPLTWSFFSWLLIGHMAIHLRLSVVDTRQSAHLTGRPWVFFWVLLYVIMRYVRYNVEPEHRLQAIDEIFFQHSIRRGESSGGAGKIGFHVQQMLNAQATK